MSDLDRRIEAIKKRLLEEWDYDDDAALEAEAHDTAAASDEVLHDLLDTPFCECGHLANEHVTHAGCLASDDEVAMCKCSRTPDEIITERVRVALMPRREKS